MVHPGRPRAGAGVKEQASNQGADWHPAVQIGLGQDTALQLRRPPTSWAATTAPLRSQAARTLPWIAAQPGTARAWASRSSRGDTASASHMTRGELNAALYHMAARGDLSEFAAEDDDDWAESFDFTQAHTGGAGACDRSWLGVRSAECGPHVGPGRVGVGRVWGVAAVVGAHLAVNPPSAVHAHPLRLAGCRWAPPCRRPPPN